MKFARGLVHAVVVILLTVWLLISNPWIFPSFRFFLGGTGDNSMAVNLHKSNCGL